MHYVKKVKPQNRLIADARSVKQELGRLQKHVLSIDQNNIGDGGFETLPGGVTEVHTGIARRSAFAPTSDSLLANGRENSGSITRYHFSTWGLPGTDISESQVWTDQRLMKHSFTVYHTAPYLFLGQATARGLMSTPQEEPLTVSMSVRLNGDVLLPLSTQSVGQWTNPPTYPQPVFYAPLFFCATRILSPGEYDSVLTIRKNRGDGQSEISHPVHIVVGFIR